MNWLFDTLRQLFNQVVFWVTVEPWDQAIRVRAGKRVRRLAPGLHWRLPVLDVIYKQSARWRASLVPTQTLSTSDGATLICGATLGYVVADIECLYRTLHHAEDTLNQLAAAAIATHVSSMARDALVIEQLSKAVTAELAARFEVFGVAQVAVRVTDFAFVRAFRLVQENRWQSGRALRTENEA